MVGLFGLFGLVVVVVACRSTSPQRGFLCAVGGLLAVEAVVLPIVL